MQEQEHVSTADFIFERVESYLNRWTSFQMFQSPYCTQIILNAQNFLVFYFRSVFPSRFFQSAKDSAVFQNQIKAKK